MSLSICLTYGPSATGRRKCKEGRGESKRAQEMAPDGMTTATAGWGAAWCGGVYGLGWLCISSSAVGLPPTLWAPAMNVA